MSKLKIYRWYLLLELVKIHLFKTMSATCLTQASFEKVVMKFKYTSIILIK